MCSICGFQTLLYTPYVSKIHWIFHFQTKKLEIFPEKELIPTRCPTSLSNTNLKMSIHLEEHTEKFGCAYVP